MTFLEDYNQDGYVVIPSLSNFEWPELWDEISFMEVLKNSGVDFYVSYLRMLAKHFIVQAYFVRDDVFDIFNDIKIESPVIIDQPVLHVMSPALRIPNGYYGTEAHQDWSSTQGSLDCVTVWIALTDADIGNFPLEVIPGSHLGGLREGTLNGSVLEVEADDKEFVPIECKAGDVVFISGFLVHRTGKGNGFRVSVSQRFDNANEPTFIERGYPCAQKRVVERTLLWKPSVEEIRKIYA